MTLLAVACGNAGSDKPVTVTTKPGAPGITQASAADLKKNVTLTGVQGVTDSDINVAVITSKTNLLGGPYGSFADGIKAYFNYMNDGGGIYGRKLNVTSNRDDQMLQNQQQVKSSLAQDKAFATFIATPLFTGAPDIAATNPQMPTFIWNINPEMAGHTNIFGTVGALCFNCIGQGSPFLAQAGRCQEGRHSRLRGHRVVQAVRDRPSATASRSTRRPRSSSSTTSSSSPRPTSVPTSGRSRRRAQGSSSPASTPRSR